MRLVLVRHGQTTSNVDDLLDTAEPGADLTDLGREQAAALVEALADQPVESVWVSTLVRTQQTAAPFAAARGLVPTVRTGLREVQAGDLEMRGDLPAIQEFMGVVAAWFRGDLDARVPGAESGSEVLARFDAVVDEIVATGEGCAMVVAHGAVLRVWAALRCGNVDGPVQARAPLSNTGVIVVEGEPGAWEARVWDGDAVGGPAVSDTVHDGPTG